MKVGHNPRSVRCQAASYFIPLPKATEVALKGWSGIKRIPASPQLPGRLTPGGWPAELGDGRGMVLPSHLTDLGALRTLVTFWALL